MAAAAFDLGLVPPPDWPEVFPICLGVTAAAAPDAIFSGVLVDLASPRSAISTDPSREERKHRRSVTREAPSPL